MDSETRDERGGIALWTFALQTYGRREKCYCDGRKEHAGWLVCVQREVDQALEDVR